jgi:hypothetical protein
LKGLAAGLSVLGCVLALGACGETVSPGKFSGESRNVAQTVSDFQKDATAGDQTKLCQNDLAAAVAARLKSGGGCQSALKDQLRQIDALNLTLESVTVTEATAQARVKSIWSGKSRLSTLTLVKEGSRWKISGTR